MPPAARLGDVHVCPATAGPAPHGAGPLLPRPGTVLVCGAPAVTSGDLAACLAGPPAAVVAGSATVYFDHRKAAREGDETSHGGHIAAGCPTVLVDDVVWSAAPAPPLGAPPPGGSPAAPSHGSRRAALRAQPLRTSPTAEGIRAQREALRDAARSGTPFAEVCEREPPAEEEA